MAQRILDHLKSRQEEMLQFLISLVEIETPSSDIGSQDAIFSFLDSALEELGFYRIRVKGRETGGYLYGRPSERHSYSSFQLLVGHCDTVWAKNTLENMPVTDADGKATGPGIYDMKAGLTQIIFALRTLRELSIPIRIMPLVIINSDEEIGSHESTEAIKRLSKLASRAFIIEPPLGPEGKLKTQRKGVGRFTISVKGRAAHAGLDPAKGVNAIVELSHQVQKLYAMNDFEKGITVNVGMIEGGYSANVVAPRSKAVIDVRVNSLADGEMISDKIYGLRPVLNDVELLVSGGMGRMPMEKTKRNQSLWNQARINGEHLGLRLEQAGAGGGSDGNTTSIYTATLDGLGTAGDGAHADHEFIYKDSLVERTSLLTMMLLDEIIEV